MSDVGTHNVDQILDRQFFDYANCGFLDGRSILITGGTGSFGRRLVEQLLDRTKCRRIIVFSRDELKQFEMEQSLEAHPNRKALRFFLGDVRDYERLKTALRDVDFIVHAAAQKQVVAAEYNPMECMKTNVQGADNLVRAAIDCRVQRVVALSTDKAVNPINLYGASKLASDKIFIAGNNISTSAAGRFSVVRYGNVIGSRGSVIPFFQRVIREGRDAMPITDPRMTRFWISLDQGVALVLDTLRTMVGGEIIVPKLPSLRISDLAHAMAPHMEHRVVGIRPGEKLHEIMLTQDDARSTLDLGDRFLIKPQFAFWGTDENWDVKWSNGRRVPEGFEYRSDTNDSFLHGAQLAPFCESVMAESLAS